VGVWADAPASASLDAVLSASATRWQYAAHAPARVGSALPVWFRLQLKQTQAFGDWVLSLPATSIQELHFYGPLDAAGRALQPPRVTGSLYAFDTRPLRSEQQAWRFVLPQPGEYTVLVRVTSLAPRTYDFKLWDVADFQTFASNKQIYDGICYGILLSMLVYNLVLLLVFRDRTYALYVLTGGFALLTLLSFNGHAARYLLPDLPVSAERLNVVFPALWIMSGALFATSFLDLKRYCPSMRALALAVAWLALCSALLGAVGLQTFSQFSNEVLALIGTVGMVVGAGRSWVAGFSPARWYLGGQLALFASVFFVVLGAWGIWEWTFMVDNGLQTGVAIEVMVFAVALSSRIRLMQSLQAELEVRTVQLMAVSETDPLTGVANRAGLAHRAQSLLQRPHQRAVLLLDLDRFKPINDEHGHEAGDAVLVEVAARVRSQLRPDDIVARVGGDEFVVVLGQGGDRHTLELVSRRLLDVIALPVDFAGLQLTVGSSLGIARFPGNGINLADLLRAADAAMYHIKKNGRAGYAFFEDLSAQDTQEAAARDSRLDAAA
jgi:diguanylate cyclase (GGDEF)-like protein